MTYDELLVARLRLVPQVIAICNSRVYHLEVFQNSPSIQRYPCVVYSLDNDDPEEELAENSGLLTATFSVFVLCNKSSELRAVVEGIKYYFNDVDNIDQIYCDTDGEITWVSCTNDREQNDFAIEQQEKGIRTSTLQIAMDHWQVEPTTTTTTTTTTTSTTTTPA